MDSKLKTYCDEAHKRTGLTFPGFAAEATHTAPILAVLHSPYNSGAEASQVVSLDNKDPTAKRTLKIVNSVGLRRDQMVLWNFYAAYEKNSGSQEFWAKELENLIGKMPKLQIIIAFGNEAWLGMRDVYLRAGIALIGAPHPSNRSCNSNPAAEDKIRLAWERAKFLLK